MEPVQPVGVPPEDNFNQMQLDQTYLYKYALMMCIHDLTDCKEHKNRDFQDVWDHYVAKAGLYVITINDKELKGIPNPQEKDNDTFPENAA